MSSSPKQQRPSAEEQALARRSMKEDQRYEDAFRPLEQQAISELKTADSDKRSAMLSGRHNADLENQAQGLRQVGLQEDTQSGRGVSSGRTTARAAEHASTIESGRKRLQVDADQTARDSIDADRLNVMQTGRGLARGSQSTLTQSANLANSKAASKLNAQGLRDQARIGALGDVTGAAIAGGYASYKRATDGNSKGTDFDITENNLSPFQKGLRSRLRPGGFPD